LHRELELYGLFITATEHGRGLSTEKALREGEGICVCSTLWYNSIAKLQEMLSVGCNKLLVDRLVRIDNLATEDGPISWYGALVGASGYAQHYAGLRKGGPNAYLRVNSSAGANDGLVEMVVKTRNAQGIAPKSLICINYGSEYDFSVQADTSETEVKRFRGALESYFTRAEPDKSGASSSNPNPTPPPPPGPVPLAPPPPLPVPVADAKPKGKSPTPGAPPVPGGLPPPGPDVVGLPTPGPGAGGLPPPPPPPPPGPIVPNPSSDQKLAADIQPLGISLHFVPSAGDAGVGAFWLAAGPGTSTNKKVPPNTKLLVLHNGKVEKSSAPDMVPYDFRNPKKSFIFLVQSSKGDLSAIKSLDAWVSELKIKKLVPYDEFAAGCCPSTLPIKEGLGFVAAEKDMKAVLKACVGLGQLKVQWAFKHNTKDSSLMPYGVVLTTSKQIIIPGGGRATLS